MQTPQAGSSSSTLECMSELWPFLNTSSLAPCAPSPSLFVTRFCVFSTFYSTFYPSIYLLSHFLCLSVFLWDILSLSRSWCYVLTFPAHVLLLLNGVVLHLVSAKNSQRRSCVHSQCLTCSLAVDFPRHPVARSHLSDGLHSLLHPSHPSTVLLLTSHLAPLSLPFLSEKWVLQRCLPDKCRWEVEELWRNAEILYKYGRKEWRL